MDISFDVNIRHGGIKWTNLHSQIHLFLRHLNTNTLIYVYIRIFSPYLISKNMNHVTVFFIDKNDLRAHNLFQITPVFRTTAMKLNNFIIYEVFGGI